MKLAALFLFLAGAQVQSVAQAVQDLPPPPPAPSLANTPLDSSQRASLEQAIKAHDYARAEKTLMDEIAKNPKSPPLLTLLGSVFFLDGKYLDSTDALKRADALSPLDDRNRLILALAHITLDHGDLARPELEKLVRSDPHNAVYPYWLSRLDYQDMHLVSAVANARRAIELDPAFMKAYDNLGLYYEALGKTEEAVQAYQQAIRLNRQKRPVSPWPSMNLGALLIKLGRLGEAEAALKDSLMEDPTFPKAHFQLGLLSEKQKKYTAAIQELRQAASLDPSYAEPYYVLGKIYRLEGDENSATQAWSMFQKLNQKEKEKAVRRSH